jgi:hypothetical protein
MGTRSAWLLNLGAEVELENPRRTIGAEARARLPDLVEKLGSLVPAGDVILFGEENETGLAEGCLGRAWLPTPRALMALSRAGALRLPVPDFEILQKANDRRFSLNLGPTLPGQRVVTSLEEVANALAHPSPQGNWLLRRPHGFAGRGRRRVRPDEVMGVAQSWIEASLRQHGALVVEPWVERLADFGLHGYVSANGEIILGEPTVQKMTEEGAWLRTRRIRSGELGRDEAYSLATAAKAAGDVLVQVGYFGPFGIDAFRWRDEHGKQHFNPRCEVNARYSMGWAIGMGDTRPDLEEK